ncbi:DlpA domain-containing protein [Stachybotrys elegans]|uniref:DlpA domain-containing protein n=1 Tax=Stachybotrys elegans TaxID=80388 RepID=A0A8K0WNA4_9HYPO|nr:DlpA domain-containing protein [Stachybotrys elegans]
MSSLTEDAVERLGRYTACDVSDALLKVGVPSAGFLADLSPYGLSGASPSGSIVIAPVSTVLFAPKGQPLSEPEPNIAPGTHWADVCEPGTVVLLKQPPGQKNAVCGGIMALRMKMLQVKGIVAAGRIRDIAELRDTGLPIWASGVSTVGVGGGSTPWATQVPIDVDGVMVTPGDIAFCDPANGVVIIPRDKLAKVLELLPKLTAADDKVKASVLAGMTVNEAFKLHRGNL